MRMDEQPDFDWFEVREFPDGVIGIGEPGHFEDVKSFLIVGEHLAMLVDTGMGFASIKSVVEHVTDRPVLVVNTHGHLDHIGDNWRFERRWAHAGDRDRIEAGVPNERMSAFLAPEAFNRNPPPGLDPETFSIPGTDIERWLEEGDQIDLGGRIFSVIYTPGHSAGSISLLEKRTGILIAGDVLYEGPLYAHHPGGSASDYRETLARIHALVPDLSVIYPSHNRYPLDPQFAVVVHEAIEQIWEGRQPDIMSEGLDRFEYPTFSFTFRETWRDE
jgi:glyoxylase-like metal-dependent hydrolase (beta-lactamase superfamily II)